MLNTVYFHFTIHAWLHAEQGAFVIETTTGFLLASEIVQCT